MGFTSNIVYMIVYNTKLAKESDVPTNWAAIADERFRGKTTSSLFLPPRFVGALGIAWGEDKALHYARDLREKTDILLTRAPRESLLQSGERVIRVRRDRQPGAALGRRRPAGRLRRAGAGGRRPVRRERDEEGAATRMRRA